MGRAKLRVAELYAGTGRSVEPFREWNRCEISLLVDANSFAAKTYRANHRDSPYLVADLSKTSPKLIKARAGGKVDILLGCPPCQGWSENGQRRPNDPRNDHLSLFGDVAVTLKPLAIGMENVPLAAGSAQFEAFVSRLEAEGYRWTAGIINSALRGSSQSRSRLIFVAIRSSAGAEPVFPEPTHGAKGTYFSYRYRELRSIQSDFNGMLGLPPSIYSVKTKLPYWESELGPKRIPTVGETIGDLPPLGSDAAFAINHVKWAHKRPQLVRMAKVPEGGRWKGGTDHYSQSYGRLHRQGFSRTITTAFPNAGSGRFWHPTENRSITLREAARIQGFPDSFLFLTPHSLGATLVGNALDKCLASLTFDVIRACIE